MICHDNQTYFDMNKLSWYKLEYALENNDEFELEWEKDLAVGLMLYINDHGDMELEWRGEYTGHEHNNGGFPPEGYENVTQEYVD